MSRTFIACTLFFIFVLVLFSCSDKKVETTSMCSSEVVTLYGTSFLKGKVSSIVYDDEQGSDSTLFVYSAEQHLVKIVFGNYIQSYIKTFCYQEGDPKVK